MPYQVYWGDDAQSIIHCEAHGHWTWAEYHQALDQIAQLARSVSYPVYVITLRMPNSHKPSGLGLPHYQRSVKVMPANVRRMVLVTGNQSDTILSNRWINTLARSLMKHITIASSMAQAQALIVEERAQELSTVGD